MRIGYARVSTEEQNLTRQLEFLNSKNCEKIFQEKISGKDKERPQLKEMLEFVREGDYIYCLEISRLGRNMKDLLEIIDFLMNKGVSLVLGDLGEIEKGNITQRVIVQVMACFAEFQREYIRKTQAEGIRKAKELGLYKRPKKSKTKLIPIEVVAQKLKEGYYKEDIAIDLGISRMTLYRYIQQHKQEINQIMATL